MEAISVALHIHVMAVVVVQGISLTKLGLFLVVVVHVVNLLVNHQLVGVFVKL